ncbi:MAG TPA: class A beta-lactamase-related serine hydrolase, partial [Pseudomonadales bacterium]|nr:class A beta-lactamase-related serine hydrolase [Pseudomonadales bacterium]
MSSTIPISGICHDQFELVESAFRSNFTGHGEVGARVSVIKDGEIVVDLCGGHTTETKQQLWDESTLIVCMSVTKGVVALAAHLLAERDQLNYDAPVAEYWPEFQSNGKSAITVRQAMAHQASLAIIDNAEPGDILDWDIFTSKIAQQAPNWTPLTNETYHSVTFGYIVGELVRRVDGRSIQRFIAEELAGPLGADYILGCQDKDLSRIVPQISNPENELMAGGLINEKTLAMFAPYPTDPAYGGSDESLKLGFPSGGGVSNALGIAKLFAPLAMDGKYNGVQLYSQETIDLMSTQQWHHDDYLFGNEFRVALGLLLDCPFNHWGRDGNVGSAGAGGYTVFADPENRVAFGYTPNRFTTGYGLGEEEKRLVDAM